MSQLNPFIYSTPDQIKDPKQALNLFVDVFKDFYLIESPGNTFVNGARGSGKSMMFRIMKPDCQKVKLKKGFSKLNYCAVYIPVKDTSLNIQELDYLKGKHGENIFNEHLMSVYFSIGIFKCLLDENFSEENQGEILGFYQNVFSPIIINSGVQNGLKKITKKSKINDIFNEIITLLESIQSDFSLYIQRVSLGPENFSYDGPLCLYRNFLLPIIKGVLKLPILPKDKPLYLLIDDADLLNESQTKILNSWVSFRTTSIVCFKITTQLSYKTWQTTNAVNKIDSPHDYHEINLSDIYTSNLKGYRDNVKAMVEKRLRHLSKIKKTAEEFFPTNKDQEEKYNVLFEKLKEEKGYDYAYRNARLDYMLKLPNQYTYSYAGFDQLVHLSSGIIRNFVDLSFKMFDKAVRQQKGNSINYIPVGIQNDQIIEYSSWILQQLDKSIEDSQLNPIQANRYKLLKNLIDSLGKAFRIYLESDTTERRKFSFYYDGDIDPEIKSVLKLGVSEGFFHYSTMGSKTGLGRSHKYVLNRILSPIYQLDSFTFSGYLYLTPDKIELAIKNEKQFLSYVRERVKNPDNDDEVKQLEIEF